MAGPLGGAGAVDPGAPTIKATSPMGPLVDADGDSGAPTINVKNIDDGLPRRCRSCRTGSTHHQRKKMSTVGPLAGVDRDPGAPTINIK
jgi:hypothetical protein